MCTKNISNALYKCICAHYLSMHVAQDFYVFFIFLTYPHKIMELGEGKFEPVTSVFFFFFNMSTQNNGTRRWRFELITYARLSFFSPFVDMST